MNKLIVVFAIAGLVSILTAACQHAETEFRDGFNCHVSGIDCPSVNLDDPNLRGPQGPTGATGSTGPAGGVGPAGADGTEVRPVQFCPGAPSYPSTFPEVGFCIGGHIYASYSANGGFLTLTPPGRYSSNAIGSRCSFTIRPNCEVLND